MTTTTPANTPPMAISPHRAARLTRTCAQYAARKGLTDLRLAVCQPSSGFEWTSGPQHEPYFIASITKLYTAAVVLQLRDEGALTLDTLAADILGVDRLRGLNTHGGVDHGPAITVRQLMSQTSGIPDYFEQAPRGGSSIAVDVTDADHFYSEEELLDRARSVAATFAPSQPGRALYSGTNYLLLGQIVEEVTGSSYRRALQERVFDRLGADQTWLHCRETMQRYGEATPIRHAGRVLDRPQALASFPPDGGVVSTVAEQMRFLRAFLGGELFPAEYLAEMTSSWNSVFSRLIPLEYGLGLMRFALPRWQSPFAPVPHMIGHSGSVGSILFYAPKRDVFIAGTVNDRHPRSLPYALLARILMAVR